MIRFVNRILDWLMRDAMFDHGDLDLTGALEWRRFRNGFVSGPYLILTNRGGGVHVSHNGQSITDGKLVDDLEAAQRVCEDHARKTAEKSADTPWVFQSRRPSTPSQED